jgi:hypothetical protein
MLFGHSEYTLPSIMRLIDQKLPQVNSQWAEEKLSALLEDIKVHKISYGFLIILFVVRFQRSLI